MQQRDRKTPLTRTPGRCSLTAFPGSGPSTSEDIPMPRPSGMRSPAFLTSSVPLHLASCPEASRSRTVCVGAAS
eukprot:2996896-Alexandrium_andersonii.AAC.1